MLRAVVSVAGEAGRGLGAAGGLQRLGAALWRPRAALCSGGAALGAVAHCRRASVLQAGLATTRGLATTAARADAPLLRAAVCLERYPRITPEKSQLQLDVEAMQAQVQADAAALMPQEVATDKADAEKAAEEARRAEADRDGFGSMSFEQEGGEDGPLVAPRTTWADKANDTTSLDRKLDRTLFLVVRRAAADPWGLPTATHELGEVGLRLTAERALSAACDLEQMQPYFLSNTPSAVQNGSLDGQDAQTYFFRALLVKGNVHLVLPYQEHAWLTLEELEGKVSEDDFGTLRSFAD
eukprot:m.489348 g.489348  ORF g.489348 m.489348 type:complete len:297 (-) comp26613_c0_seq1:106-996(-)